MPRKKKLLLGVVIIVILAFGIFAGRQYEKSKIEKTETQSALYDSRLTYPVPPTIPPHSASAPSDGGTISPPVPGAQNNAILNPPLPPSPGQQVWGTIVRVNNKELVISKPGAMKNGVTEQREIKIILNDRVRVMKGVYGADGSYSRKQVTVEEIEVGRLAGVVTKQGDDESLEALEIELNERL